MKHTLPSITAKLGYITAALLVSAGVASIVLYGLAFLVVNQYQLMRRQTADHQAYSIAEAGINYYAWHLAHNPTDYWDGNGPGSSGPYLHEFSDPQGGVEGYFSLEIDPPATGSSILTITSTGWTVAVPDLTRTVTAKYGERSFASYAFLYDHEAWFDENFIVIGPVHANGGIRNDGMNSSLVTSAAETYLCTNKNGGCTPNEDKPGVWGSGGDQGLWQFPVTPVDFAALAVDFSELKVTAQDSELYLAPSDDWGYHLVFNGNGTFDVYEVDKTDKFKGGKGNPGCEQFYAEITEETLLGTYNTADYLLVFVEDDLWVEGTVTSSITITAVKFPLETEDANIWITGNFVYPARNGTVQTGLMSESGVFFHRDIPDNFQLDAAILAQTGDIMRHDYSLPCAGNPANAVRNNMYIYGSIIASGQTKWNWGTTGVNSGFLTSTIVYDANLRFNPPPFFPTTGEIDILGTL